MTPETSDATRQRLDDAAAVLAGWPRVWARLIEHHLCGPDGRCSVCTYSNRGAPYWPCGPAALALRARRAATERELA